MISRSYLFPKRARHCFPSPSIDPHSAFWLSEKTDVCRHIVPLVLAILPLSAMSNVVRGGPAHVELLRGIQLSRQFLLRLQVVEEAPPYSFPLRPSHTFALAPTPIPIACQSSLTTSTVFQATDLTFARSLRRFNRSTSKASSYC